MSVPAIAFFNSSGGIGRTSLVYHLAWMFSDLNVRVLAADLAPQAGLTAMFLPEDLLIDVWGDETRLISTRITDELIRPILLPFDDNLVLLPGNVALLEGEDELATKWSLAMSGIEEGVTGMSALSRSIQTAAELTEAQIILMDLGCNLGAVTRAAMISANYIVFPLTTDLVTLQSLPHVGATLSRWRKGWINCQNERRAGHLTPSGLMQPIGYIVQQLGTRLDHSEGLYRYWIDRIPWAYHTGVLAEPSPGISVLEDPCNLGTLRHYRSLMPMAREARKPMFHLKPADGAIGAYLQSAEDARKDFEALAKAIVAKANLPIQFAS